MSDFNVRSDNVDVEQIMRQIRARIREKRGVDYTEEEIRELANVKLEKFIDPKGVRSGLLEEYRRVSTPEPPAPNYAFGEDTLYETHRGPIRWLRALFRPFLKLLFNPNPLIQALHIQADLNQRHAERHARREQLDALHYEVIHNLVVELTRTGVEVKALKMRLESMASRLDFDERRARALEGVVQYRAGAVAPQQPPAHQDQGRRDQGQRTQGPRDQGPRDQRPQQGRREQAPQDRWQRPSVPGPSVPGSSVPRSPVPGSPVPGSSVPASSVPGSSVPGSSAPGSSVSGSPMPGVPDEANALDADGNLRRARRRRRRGRRRPGDRDDAMREAPASAGGASNASFGEAGDATRDSGGATRDAGDAMREARTSGAEGRGTEPGEPQDRPSNHANRESPIANRASDSDGGAGAPATPPADSPAE